MRARSKRFAEGLQAFCLALLLAGFGSVSVAQEATQDPVFDFSIPRQAVDSALIEFAEQADLTLVFPDELVYGKFANELNGRYTCQDGIDILLAGTGLVPEFSNEIVLSIAATDTSASEGEIMKIGKKIGLFAALAGVFGSANAQTSDFLDEVVVTATKRSESIQDIPASVTAFTGATMDKLQMVRADDIANQTPGLNWKSSAGNSKSTIFLRGVGDNGFQANVVGAVGIFMDEVYLSSTIVNTFQLFDMERVEVVRGPQNILYGRNTTGGAINFISRKPQIDEETHGRVKATLGSDGRADLEAAVGFSLGERAAGRVSIATQNRDGYFNHPTLGDLGTVEKLSGRLQILFEPSDAVSLLWSVHGGDSSGSDRPYTGIGLLDPVSGNQIVTEVRGGHDLQPGAVNLAGDSNFVGQGAWDSLSSHESLEDIDAMGSALSLDVDLNGVLFKSISAWETNDFLIGAQDIDGLPAKLLDFQETSEQSQFSQEFRFSSDSDSALSWIAGAYFFHEDLSLATSDDIPAFGIGGSRVELDQDTYNAAVYAQLKYAVSDQLSLSGGLRYTRETKDGDLSAFTYSSVPLGTFITAAIANANRTGPTTESSFDNTWKRTNFEVIADYALNDNVLIYGKVSDGFKGGGVSVNANGIANGQGSVAVDPEEIISYELGVKATLLDGKLLANAAVFSIDWTEQQLSFVNNGIPTLTNAGEASNTGFELEVDWLPLDSLYVHAGLSVQDGEYDVFVNPFDASQDFSGNKLALSPDLTANILVRNEWSVMNDGVFSVQVDANYQDHVFFGGENSPLAQQDSYWLAGASASLAFGANNNYELSVWVKNISDEEYAVDGFDLGFIGTAVYNMGDPRSYGLYLIANFD